MSDTPDADRIMENIRIAMTADNHEQSVAHFSDAMRDCEIIERERNDLRKKLAVWEYENRSIRVELESQQERLIDWFIVAQELKTVVADCLEENKHLTDGDQCTLKGLRDGYEKACSTDRPAIRLTGEMLRTAKFTGPMSTALIFAARYTHNRNTGGTLAVVRALEMVWHHIEDHTRDQILRELHDAEYNLDDWQRLRDFAEKGGGE
jgi:hypothetical protein